MSGIIVALIVPMVIMPMLGVDKAKWITVMSILSILALPLTLLEYYFTKERVTAESNGREEKKIPFTLQLKAIFTDKFMLLILGYFLLYTLTSQLKNLSLPYYCNYVLGTYNDGITQTLVSVLGGIPMGIGIFAVWPLAKKIGKKNITVLGFVLYALGSGICWIAPSNLYIVLVGQFIKNIGGLPCAYVFMNGHIQRSYLGRGLYPSRKHRRCPRTHRRNAEDLYKCRRHAGNYLQPARTRE